MLGAVRGRAAHLSIRVTDCVHDKNVPKNRSESVINSHSFTFAARLHTQKEALPGIGEGLFED